MEPKPTYRAGRQNIPEITDLLTPHQLEAFCYHLAGIIRAGHGAIKIVVSHGEPVLLLPEPSLNFRDKFLVGVTDDDVRITYKE